MTDHTELKRLAEDADRQMPGMLKRYRCGHAKHDYRETGACDAICCGCGKNLGFIGTVREQRAGGERP